MARPQGDRRTLAGLRQVEKRILLALAIEVSD